MTILLCFILGIAFYGLAMPILESLTSLVATILEYHKGKYAVKLMKMQEELGCDCDKETTYAIGFHTDDGITLDDMDEEEWEEEDE